VTPRERLVALAAGPESARALAEAALWLAAEEYPDLDVAAWLGRLDALGARGAARLAPGLDADAAAGALAGHLAGTEGFRGNAGDYYDPRNSFLNEVLERRLGIPITLSVVYMAVGARAGLAVRGIGLPGHFVVRVERGGRSRLLDPFDGGRRLAEADCEALIRRVHGPAARLRPEHLRPVSTREVLVRMLSNLKGVYTALGDWERALAAVDRLLLLAPGALGERRDRGALLVRLGRRAEAAGEWEAYIRQAPEASDVEVVRGRLRALRQALGSLN
jgi:regulator of sirC expression with transglutaminase-like and TPR domain